MSGGRHELVVAPAVRRQLAEGLSESVAFAAYGFITGPLCADPYRAGGRLRPPLDDRYSARRGTYRVVYQIDEGRRTVYVLAVRLRGDVYGTR